MNLFDYYKNYIDEDYKKFHMKLCNTKYEILGIKVPNQRLIAKSLLKEYELSFILNNINNDYYENIMIKGLCIGYAKISLDNKLELIDKFIPLIDNWAICDTFVSTLKIFNKDQDYLYNYLLKHLNSNNEFNTRFALVVMLNYYVNDSYYKKLYKVLDNVNTEYYYTYMASAWLLSYLFIKYYDETIIYVKNSKLDKKTINKGIQKSIESFRINKDKKICLHYLKNSL